MMVSVSFDHPESSYSIMFMSKAFVLNHKIILSTEMLVVKEFFSFMLNFSNESSLYKLISDNSIDGRILIALIREGSILKRVCAKFNESLDSKGTCILIKLKDYFLFSLTSNLNVHKNILSVFSRCCFFQCFLCKSLIDNNSLCVHISKFMERPFYQV